MKRTELKKIIRESIEEVVQEVNYDTSKGGKPVVAIGAPGSRKRQMAVADPTREEMLEFLKKTYGREEGFEDAAEVAMYWFANWNHGGQWSNLYSVLSTSQFNPGPISRGPEPGSMEEMMEKDLESEYSKGAIGEVSWHDEESYKRSHGDIEPEKPDEQQQEKWKHLSHGFYEISSNLAKKLGRGTLPPPGHERLIVAPREFPTKRGFAWLAQTKQWGQMVWSI
jgi:hypothetical protein